MQPFIFPGIQIACFPFKNLLRVMFLHSLVPTFSRRMGVQKLVLFYVIFFSWRHCFIEYFVFLLLPELEDFQDRLLSCWPRGSHHCHTRNSFHISSWDCIPHFLGVLHSFISVSSIIFRDHILLKFSDIEYKFFEMMNVIDFLLYTYVDF